MIFQIKVSVLSTYGGCHQKEFIVASLKYLHNNHYNKNSNNDNDDDDNNKKNKNNNNDNNNDNKLSSYITFHLCIWLLLSSVNFPFMIKWIFLWTAVWSELGHYLTGWPLNYTKIQNIKIEKSMFVFLKKETMLLQEPECLATAEVNTYLNKPAAKSHRFLLICITNRYKTVSKKKVKQQFVFK